MTGEKRQETEPKKSFDTFDKLGRKEFADRLTTAIERFTPLYDEAFVISMNAGYGTGKTTFLEMWQTDLEEKGHEVIYINAWESDFDSEPLLHIVSAIIDKIGSKEGTLKGALMGLIGGTALATNALLAHATGVDPIKISQEVDKSLKTIGESVYGDFTYKQGAYKELKDTLTKYARGLKTKPLIILVDELDRVRPNYAVKFLEAIKHVFSVPGLCFVLAVDRTQLEKSVRQLYGDIDFNGYYLRFVSRVVKLQTPESAGINKFILYQWDRFFGKGMKNGIFFVLKDQSTENIIDFIENVSHCFNLSLREIESLIRCLSHVLALSDNKEKSTHRGIIDATILLLALSIKDKTRYAETGNNTMTPEQIGDYFKGKKYRDKQEEYYILETAIGASITTNEDRLTRLAKVLVPYYKEGTALPDIITELRLRWSPNNRKWYRQSLFEDLYSQIENFEGFFDDN